MTGAVQIMFKVLALAAIAGPGLVSAKDCGFLESQCCPGEICLRERSVCFWGTCKPCGGDGNPQCESAPHCIQPPPWDML